MHPNFNLTTDHRVSPNHPDYRLVVLTAEVKFYGDLRPYQRLDLARAAHARSTVVPAWFPFKLHSASAQAEANALQNLRSMLGAQMYFGKTNIFNHLFNSLHTDRRAPRTLNDGAELALHDSHNPTFWTRLPEGFGDLWASPQVRPQLAPYAEYAVPHGGFIPLGTHSAVRASPTIWMWRGQVEGVVPERIADAFLQPSLTQNNVTISRSYIDMCYRMFNWAGDAPDLPTPTSTGIDDIGYGNLWDGVSRRHNFVVPTLGMNTLMSGPMTIYLDRKLEAFLNLRPLTAAQAQLASKNLITLKENLFNAMLGMRKLQ